MGLKKSFLVNLRISEDLFDEIEKTVSEEISNFSEITRKFIKLGMKMYKIPKIKMTPEGIEEMKKEVNKKIKDETFFSTLDALNFEQQQAIKTYLEMKNEN